MRRTVAATVFVVSSSVLTILLPAASVSGAAGHSVRPAAKQDVILRSAVPAQVRRGQARVLSTLALGSHCQPGGHAQAARLARFDRRVTRIGLTHEPRVPALSHPGPGEPSF